MQLSQTIPVALTSGLFAVVIAYCIAGGMGAIPINSGFSDPFLGHTPVQEMPNMPILPSLLPEIIPDGSIGETSRSLQTMAWIYPGEPACDAPVEFKARSIDVLKPEYFLITSQGKLTLLTVEADGCNAFSRESLAEVKQYSKEQFITVASADSRGMRVFLTNALTDPASIDELVDFAVEHEVTGIELDFEDFGGWDDELYTQYKNFLKVLGDELHANNKKLMIDGPAISNDVEQGYFVWRYEDFGNLPVDHVVVMAYDHQYDYGPGTPISPLVWLENVVKWTVRTYPYPEKITIGLPSYGYRGERNTQEFELLTLEQMRNEPGFAGARRDPVSSELTWTSGSSVFHYHDAVSLNTKLAVVQKAGINSVSVWHLGGNPWFTAAEN